MNITVDELRSWCPECAATLDVIVPGWVRCPRCGWEEFKRGLSRRADRAIEQRESIEARECYEDDTSPLKIPYKRGGSRKSGRYRGRNKKSWWKPWYMRSVGI
ncbi:MAG: hypothetical protein HPY52_10705 [Firmicutes bacterium]|nr:hypothetical protein [Bacillota bacterium]